MTKTTQNWKIGDCLDLMREYPNNHFDLVLTDPPYGIGMSKNPVRQKHCKSDWDVSPPSAEYFTEIFRVSRNQVIWGGNYFIEHLHSSKCFLIWNKLQPENFTLGMCEAAWTSFDSPAKMFTQSVHKEGNKLHPTQKPVSLFMWILEKYSKEGDLICDPFLGSGTTLEACRKTNRNCIGFEISDEWEKHYNKRCMKNNPQLENWF